MAHNLATDANGIATYTGRQAGWHQLGEVTGRFQTAAEIQSKAWMDWTVEKRQLYGLASDGSFSPIDAFGTFRQDNGEFLSTVGQDYEVIQHGLMFDAAETLIGETGNGAYFETAGMLRNGSGIWAQVNLTDAMGMSIGDDKHETFMLFSTSHDGSKAFDIRTGVIRVVCNNTLTAALRSSASNAVKIYHTVGAKDKMIDALEALGRARKEFATMEEKLNFLNSRLMSGEVMAEVMTELFRPKKEDKVAPEYTQRGVTRYENLMSDILERYESNDANAFPEQRGTAYNLLQAITGYVDHGAGDDDQKRALSANFGLGDKRKSRALEIITLAANGLPTKSTRYAVAGSDTSWSTPDAANRDAVADLLGVG